MSFDERPVSGFVLNAQALEVLKGHHALAHPFVHIAQTFGLHHHDALEVGQLVERLDDLVGLFLILAHHQLNVSVVEHVGHLRRRTGRVDADGNPAHQTGPHLREHPFDAVLGEHADMATG